MVQIVKRSGKKLKPGMLSEAIQSAIDSSSSLVLVTLIENSRTLGLERSEMVKKITKGLSSSMKLDFSAETYHSIENAYSLAEELVRNGYLPSNEPFKRSTAHSLNHYLAYLLGETTRKAEKGLVGIIGFTKIDDFTRKLALAKNTGIITDEYFSERATLFGTYLLKKGKLNEFNAFARSLFREVLLDGDRLKEKFHNDAMIALKNGSERIYFNVPSSFKNQKRVLELNTFTVAYNLNEFQNLGVISRKDAKEVALLFMTRGLINKIDFAPPINSSGMIKPGKLTDSLLVAINSGEFEKVERFSRLLRD